MATAEEVLELVVARVTSVMAVDEGSVTAETRFDEDLHADSLDLVEVVEGVEGDLRRRGERVSIPDDELVGLRTVGEAAERIAASSSPAAESP